MGHSPSIEDLKKRSDAFANYLNDHENRMKKIADKEGEQYDLRIAKFYKENEYNHQKMWMEGMKYDFQHSDNFSFDNISKIVTAVRVSLFGQDEESVSAKNDGEFGSNIKRLKIPGVTLNTDKEVDAAAKQLYGHNIVIAAKCMRLITNILLSFTHGTTASMQSVYKTEPLAHGFRFFVVVHSNAIKSTEFFNNKEITQTMVKFGIYYCKDEAVTQNEVSIRKSYENELAVLIGLKAVLLDQLQNDQIKPEVYFSLSRVHEQHIRQLNKRLEVHCCEVKDAA